jgi:hypothetical protein
MVLLLLHRHRWHGLAKNLLPLYHVGRCAAGAAAGLCGGEKEEVG